jgi:hypothetical protein
MVLVHLRLAYTTAVPHDVPVNGGAVMPIWSILNQFASNLVQEVNGPLHGYIQIMMGPCW